MTARRSASVLRLASSSFCTVDPRVAPSAALALARDGSRDKPAVASRRSGRDRAVGDEVRPMILLRVSVTASSWRSRSAPCWRRPRSDTASLRVRGRHGGLAFSSGCGSRPRGSASSCHSISAASFARTPILARAIAAAEAIVKGVLAGFVSLLTFAGTDAARLWWVAAIFAACVWAGANLLRWLSIRFGVAPCALGLLPPRRAAGAHVRHPGIVHPGAELRGHRPEVVFDLPEGRASPRRARFLFVLKQKFDEMIVALAGAVVPPDLARAIGAVVSVNVLTGFIAAIYAVAVAEDGPTPGDGGCHRTSQPHRGRGRAGQSGSIRNGSPQGAGRH